MKPSIITLDSENRSRVAGNRLHAGDVVKATQAVAGLVENGRGGIVITPNVDQVLHAEQNPEFRAIIRDADLLLADGMPVVLLSRLLGDRVVERVTGADLMPEVVREAEIRGWRVAAVGGEPQVMAAAQIRFAERFPGVDLHFVDLPLIGGPDDPRSLAAVTQLRNLQPDIVFVCLGSPKQELWVQAWRKELPVAVFIGVGAAIDFAAGTRSRAPRVAQRLGGEWLWRMAQEPRRLAGRYLLRGPSFVGVGARAIAWSGSRASAPARLTMMQAASSVVLSALLYAMLIAAEQTGSTAAIMLALVFVGFVTAAFVRTGFASFFIFWVVLALGQVVLIGLLAPPSAEIGFLVSEAKTVSFVVAFLLWLPQIWRYFKRHRVAAGFLIAFAAIVLLGLREVSPSALAYARNFALPLLMALLSAAVTADWSRAARLSLLRRVTAGATVALVVGSCFEAIVGTAAWRDMVGAAQIRALGSLSETTYFFGVELIRAGGLLGEPITAGYVGTGLAIVIVALWKANAFATRWVPPLLLVAAATTTVLAGTKSGMLMFAVAIGMVLLLMVIPRALRGRLTPVVLVAAWAGSVAAVLAYMLILRDGQGLRELFLDPISQIGGDSSFIHWAGLVLGVGAGFQNPLGAGLGEGGNFSRSFSAVPTQDYSIWLATGSESAIGVLAFQLGLIGLLAFAFAIALLVRSWGSAAVVLIGVWSANAIMAESMFGPLVAWIFMIGAALIREEANVVEDGSAPASALFVRRNTDIAPPLAT